MASGVSNIEELKERVPVPELPTDEAVEEIAKSLLLQLYTYGEDPKLDKEIEAAYSRVAGLPFDRDVVLPANGRVAPIMLMGPPGHGKTTIFTLAARRVAEELGLNFVDTDHLAPDTKIGNKDFLFCKKPLGGHVSAAPVTGVPTRVDTDAGPATWYMMPLELARLVEAGAALLLLDDVAHANPHIVGALLSLFDPATRRERLGSHVLVGGTGNLGKALDGTNANVQGTEIISRCSVYYVADEVGHFIDRLNARNRGRKALLGRLPPDVGIVGFLRLNPDAFTELPNRDGPYPSPRAWEQMLSELPRKLYEAAGGTLERFVQGGERRLLAFVASHLGLKTAERLVGYYDAMLSSCMGPISTLFEDRPKKGAVKAALKEIAERLGQRLSAEETNLSRTMAVTLAEHLAMQVVSSVNEGGMSPSDALADALERAAPALPLLVPAHTGLSIAHAMDRLRAQEVDLFDELGVVQAEVAKRSGDVLAEALANTGLDEARREAIVSDALDAMCNWTIDQPPAEVLDAMNAAGGEDDEGMAQGAG